MFGANVILHRCYKMFVDCFTEHPDTGSLQATWLYFQLLGTRLRAWHCQHLLWSAPQSVEGPLEDSETWPRPVPRPWQSSPSPSAAPSAAQGPALGAPAKHSAPLLQDRPGRQFAGSGRPLRGSPPSPSLRHWSPPGRPGIGHGFPSSGLHKKISRPIAKIGKDKLSLEN